MPVADAAAGDADGGLGMRLPGRTSPWLLMALAAVGGGTASCRSARPPAPAGPPGDLRAEDPFGRVWATLLEEGRTVVRSSYALRPEDHSSQLLGCEKSPVPLECPQAERLHPLVSEWLAQRPDAEKRLVVSLDDPLAIPRFPEPAAGEPWDSAANQRARERAREIVGDLELDRAAGYADFERDLLEACPEARVTGRSWLAAGVAVTTPLGCADVIAHLRNVVFVEPVETQDAAPGSRAQPTDGQELRADECDGVDAGRCRLRSDPYFDLGLDGGWIGVLDTGMLSSQVLFDRPSRIRLQADCAGGRANAGCREVRRQEDPCNHGTKTGTVLSANRRLGDPFRGVTGIDLFSYNVFSAQSADPSCSLDTWAAVRGFEAAVAALSQVIVAEITAEQGSILSRLADRAFDAGAVVVAAAGNTGSARCTVRSPAEASRVLGVGAFNVVTTDQFDAQSRGPALDGRVKPDLQAPTDTRTGDASADDGTSRYTQTSGATPYAAGAAALARDWLLRESATRDPGQTYAQLILSGQAPFPFDDTTGAGPIELPTGGWVWWGKVSITDGESVAVPLRVDEDGFDTFDGALWWAQETPEHDDLDLLLVDPEGEIRAASCAPTSIFERARADGAISPGTWKLRIEGARVRTGRQTVYWAARVWERLDELPRDCAELEAACRPEPP